MLPYKCSLSSASRQVNPKVEILNPDGLTSDGPFSASCSSAGKSPVFFWARLATPPRSVPQAESWPDAFGVLRAKAFRV